MLEPDADEGTLPEEAEKVRKGCIERLFLGMSCCQGSFYRAFALGIEAGGGDVQALFTKAKQTDSISKSIYLSHYLQKCPIVL